MPQTSGSATQPAFGRIAIAVTGIGGGWVVSPFFAKCDGVLVVDRTTRTEAFHRNDGRTPNSVCATIAAISPDCLVCGYVGEAERKTLRSAGIDIRLGSCTCPIRDLSHCVCELPVA